MSVPMPKGKVTSILPSTRLTGEALQMRAEGPSASGANRLSRLVPVCIDCGDALLGRCTVMTMAGVRGEIDLWRELENTSATVVLSTICGPL